MIISLAGSNIISLKQVLYLFFNSDSKVEGISAYLGLHPLFKLFVLSCCWTLKDI